MGKKRFVQNSCIPRRVWIVNSMLNRDANDPRKRFIEDSCFNGLLYVKARAIRVEAILSLIAYWNPERECFILADDREWHITDEAVARVYGIPCGFGKLPIRLDKGLNTDFADGFSGQYGLTTGGGSLICDGELRSIVENQDIDATASSDDYWRLYTLYALYALLIPDTSHKISSKYLQFLTSPEAASRYNWASLIKDKLVDGLNEQHYRKGGRGRPTGDVHCLMHMFYDYISKEKLAGLCYTCCVDRSLTSGDVDEHFKRTRKGKTKRKKILLQTAKQMKVGNDGIDNGTEEKYIAKIARYNDLIAEYMVKKDELQGKLDAIKGSTHESDLGKSLLLPVHDIINELSADLKALQVPKVLALPPPLPEVGPTDDVVQAFMSTLVDPLFPPGFSKAPPSQNTQNSVAKQMHAVVLLYNYYHRKQNPELSLLDCTSFMTLLRKNASVVHFSADQLSVTEEAMRNAYKIAASLDASQDVPDTEGCHISKVAVLLIDSTKGNCLLQFGSITQGVWSTIENEINEPDTDLGISAQQKRKRIDQTSTNDDYFLQLAYDAVKDSTGYASSELEVLKTHVTYSLSKEKSATHFYLMQYCGSFSTYKLIPLNLLVKSLQGPLVENFPSGSWRATSVVEYYHMLPYVDFLACFLSGRSAQFPPEAVPRRITDMNQQPQKRMKASPQKSEEQDLGEAFGDVTAMSHGLRVESNEGTSEGEVEAVVNCCREERGGGPEEEESPEFCHVKGELALIREENRILSAENRELRAKVDKNEKMIKYLVDVFSEVYNRPPPEDL